MFRKLIIGIFSLILGVGGYLKSFNNTEKLVSPLPGNTNSESAGQPTPTEIPPDYEPYTFENLSKRKLEPGKIKLGVILAKEEKFTSYVFAYQSDGKTISGMVNVPLGSGKSFGFAQDKFPVIILLRGYADKKYYKTGLGTEKSANFLAENGFLTLAPDFLGYGYSDWEDKDILMARFYRPVEVLNLLAAIDNLPQADNSKIGLWGHSNGGQIALSILEITGKSYPTSLLAPVSLDFPQCILTYLGAEEVGNIVKEKIDSFLILNDSKKFSVSPYLSKIKSPFIIHQATTDPEIKKQWTDSLVNKLKNQGLSVKYYLYSKENHNFNRYKETGDLLRKRDLEFFTNELKVQN